MGWADSDGPGDNPVPSAMASCALWCFVLVGFILFLAWLIASLVRDLT